MCWRQADQLHKEGIMRQWGIYLLIFGIGAFILPMVGLQFTILSVFGDSLPLVAGAMAVAGGTMFGLSYRQQA
jgi:hypothetical protein